jgi:excinuclease UvrABC ATPase subunit
VSKTPIRIGDAWEHNFKNLTEKIPRGRLVVITGLGRSGKSSFAFDTIYVEGQRKYVESQLPLRAAVVASDPKAGHGLHLGLVAHCHRAAEFRQQPTHIGRSF